MLTFAEKCYICEGKDSWDMILGVLLHNGSFCNGYITKRFLQQKKVSRTEMILFQDCSVRKEERKNLMFFVMF
jgi:hypothetical protein